jgi:response regulator of citrate/malate metabolism
LHVSSSDLWRVLVVEDDEVIAAVHCRFVAQQPGFRLVGRAGTASEAEQLIATTQPDLVLLDLELPGPSGLALLRRMRLAKRTVEVIVITAHARSDVVRACMQLGAVDYLVKPFWPDRLADALHGFAARMDSLRGAAPMDQQAIDRIRTGADAGSAVASPNIRRDRLHQVRHALEGGAPMTAEEVAQATGIARVTARRYLEHLVSQGQCTVDAVADGPGRPRKAYQLWLDGPVGARGGIS